MGAETAQRATCGLRASPARPERSRHGGRLADLGLPEVGHEEHRLAGQERVAAQAVRLLAREPHLPQRPLGLERLLEPQEERLLGHVLRLLRLLDVGLEALEPPLHGGEVGQDQLELEHGRVAQGVDRALGVGDGLRLEGPHHVHEDVHPAQRRQVHEGLSLPLRDAGHVHVLDRGQGSLLRPEDLRQTVDARVGDPGDAHPRLRPAAGGGGRGTGQQLEEGALAGEGQPEDSRLHARIIRGGHASGVRCRIAARRCCPLCSLSRFRRAPRCRAKALPPRRPRARAPSSSSWWTTPPRCPPSTPRRSGWPPSRRCSPSCAATATGSSSSGERTRSPSTT